MAEPEALDRITRLLAPRHDDEALDIGTGHGAAAIHLSKYVKKVLAIDAEPSSAEFLPKRSNIKFHRLNLHSGRLPFNDLTYDIVICRASLHHLGNKRRFLEEAFRILRPGGRLYLLDAVMSRDLLWTWSILSRLTEEDYRGSCTSEELVDLIRRAGFTIRHTDSALFPRRLKDWINGKVCRKGDPKNKARDPLIAHLRKTPWETIWRDFPEDWKTELRFVPTSRKGQFYYTLLEVLAGKEGENV